MTGKWGEIQGWKSDLVQVSGRSGYLCSSYRVCTVLLSFILADGLLGLGILGGTALVVGGAAALLGMAFASRK